MYNVHVIVLIVCVHYTSSQYYPPQKSKSKSPCESSAQVALVEQFFNIIFTEFQVNPPVCVCVQMCSGQSTYCYPNGCLKRDNLKRVDSPQTTLSRGAKSFMFIVDEKNDLGKNVPEAHTEEPKTTPPSRETMHDFMIDMRPDVFKNKYNMLVKHKKTPNIKLKYNLREQVKYMKGDQIKTETLEFSKTRWPQNRATGAKHRIRAAPSRGKTNVFMSMLPAGHYAEYTPKYSKRDITSMLKSDDPIAKAFYLYENSDNNTDNGAETPISLETLIDNLIRSSITAKNSENNNTDFNIEAENQPENSTAVLDERLSDTYETTTMNATVDVITLNLTDEIIDKNKYTDYIPTTTNTFNEMIKNLSKQIDIQNNTSLELAKRIVTDFDEERPLDENNKSNITLIETSTAKKLDDDIVTVPIEIDSTTDHLKENIVTKKNRQKRARSSKQSKIYQSKIEVFPN